MASDWFTESNIRRAATMAYDRAAYAPASFSWFRHGPMTDEKRTQLGEMLRGICPNCDMTPYLDTVWDRIEKLMMTFGEPGVRP